jgi:hypothetical protein
MIKRAVVKRRRKIRTEEQIHLPPHKS